MIPKLRGWRMLARTSARLLMLLLVGVVGPASMAVAQTSSAVDGFFGRFDGESMYPADEFGRRTLNVVIGPRDGDGFFVEWETSMEKLRGDSRKTRDRLDFVPDAANARIYRALADDGSVRSHDPLDGERFAWAAIKDNILSVNVLTVQPNGDYIVQTYDRARTGAGMTLSFVRVRNGEVEKRIWGSLQRVGDE